MLYDVLFKNKSTGTIEGLEVEAPSAREARAKAISAIGTDDFAWYRTLSHKTPAGRARRACTVVYSSLEPDENGAPVIRKYCVEVLNTWGDNEKTVRKLAKKQGNPIPDSAMITDIAPHKPDATDVVEV